MPEAAEFSGEVSALERWNIVLGFDFAHAKSNQELYLQALCALAMLPACGAGEFRSGAPVSAFGFGEDLFTLSDGADSVLPSLIACASRFKELAETQLDYGPLALAALAKRSASLLHDTVERSAVIVITARDVAMDDLKAASQIAHRAGLAMVVVYLGDRALTPLHTLECDGIRFLHFSDVSSCRRQDIAAALHRCIAQCWFPAPSFAEGAQCSLQCTAAHRDCQAVSVRHVSLDTVFTGGMQSLGFNASLWADHRACRDYWECSNGTSYHWMFAALGMAAVGTGLFAFQRTR